MPRASFAGIAFDFLVQGLQDTHEGMVAVREVPASAGAGSVVAYVDLGGRRLHRRTVNVLLDNEAQYAFLAGLPGSTASNGPLVYDDVTYNVVLLSVTRYLRRGGPQFQLCRTEWLFINEELTAVAAAPQGQPPPQTGAPEATG